MSVFIILVLIAALFDAIGGFLDATETHKGIVRGVAVEGNTWLVALWGDKPSYAKLLLWVAIFLVPQAVCGFFLAHSSSYTHHMVSALPVGGMLGDGARHFYYAWKWHKLGA
jgi:hypothetical protein